MSSILSIVLKEVSVFVYEFLHTVLSDVSFQKTVAERRLSPHPALRATFPRRGKAVGV